MKINYIINLSIFIFVVNMPNAYSEETAEIEINGVTFMT
jgi:hypothetical protein